ncbi:MAG: hypothetical protein KY476_20225, partial [Planctomycetes bacterium]|nr:hypothetical protein [Planctomycetota bacterium]
HLSVDFSGGDPAPSGGVNFHGGPGGFDSMDLKGGAVKSVAYDFANAADGKIHADAVRLVFTGLEPIADHLDAADRVFTFDGGSESITLSDNGSADGLMTIDSKLSESVTFTNPTRSLNIFAGTGDDLVKIGSVDAAFGATLTIDGGSGDDTAFLDADITFAAGNDLNVDLGHQDPQSAGDRIHLGPGANLLLSGTGSATLEASRSIELAPGSSITTADGDITLAANQQTTPASGDFDGIRIDGGAVQSTASGRITLHGRGGDTGDNQDGIVLLSGGQVIGGSGAVTIVGQGGNSTGTTGHRGVFAIGTGSRITSGGGHVQVTGTGGAGGAGLNFGVFLQFGGEMTAGAGGTISVEGIGGDATGGSNYGVFVFGAGSRITSDGGAVKVIGTGGGTDGSGGNYGVAVQNVGEITAGGSGAVTVHGFGGNTTGSGASNFGVFLSGSGSKITAGGGVDIIGTSGGGGSSSFGLAAVNNSAVTSTSTGNIQIIADSISLNSGSIDAGGNTVTLAPQTVGTEINLGGGDAAGTLGLSDSELDAITAGILRIGSRGAGDITVSQAISPAGADTLHLISAAGVSQMGSMNVTNLAVEAGETVTLKNGNDVDAIAIHASSGNVFFQDSDGFTVTRVDGVDGIRTLSGQIQLLAFSGSVTLDDTAAAKDIEAESLIVELRQDGGLLTVASGATVSTTGFQIVTADRMELAGALVAPGQTVTLRNFTSGKAIDLGSATDAAAGMLELSDAELDRIAAGTVSIGRNDGLALTDAITITAAVDPAGADTLRLISGGSVSQSSGNLAVPNLAVEADGNVLLNVAGNSFLRVAAASAAGLVALDSSVPVTVGTVDGVFGLSAGGGSLRLTSHGGDILVEDTPAAHDLTAAGTISLVVDAIARLTLAEGTVSHSTGGDHLYLANRMHLAGTIVADGRRVTLRPLQNLQAIDLGSTTDAAFNTLELSDEELDRITADVLQIGMGHSTSPITITAAISPAGSDTLHLITAGAIIFDPGSLDTAGGELLLSPGAGGVQPITSGVDATVGSVAFPTSADLRIGIDGTTVDTHYSQLNVSGTVDLDGVDLALRGARVPVNRDVFTIVSATSVHGTFNGLNDGDFVLFNGKPLTINYGPTAVTLTANLDPVITNVSNSGPVDEGSAVTVTVSATNAPGNSGVLRYEFDFDNDGIFEVGPQSSHAASHIFADDGVYLVNVRVSDDDGEATASTTVTVNNLAPTLENLAVTSPIDENDFATLTGTIVDPGTLDTFTLDIDWGDPLSPSNTETIDLSSPPAHVTWDPITRRFSVAHQYLDDNASDTYTVSLTVTDDDGGQSVAVADEIGRVSVDSGGTQGNSSSFEPSISADGRYVAFESIASNLVAGDTNSRDDVFVHDRQTGQTSRVSVHSGGTQGNSDSVRPSISADGRYVAFYSHANNLVAGDTNGTADVFVHDRQTGQTSRVSQDSGGTQGNSGSVTPSISADGRYVAFYSFASDLVAGDINGTHDVFVHDRQTGQTSRVSVDSGGTQGNSQSVFPSISADGRYVAFTSSADNLVAGDTNGAADAFVHDRQTGQTSRISVDSGGTQGNSSSGAQSISADGRYVAFISFANNLVAGDTNGTHDIFVHDRQTGQTSRVSVHSGGTQGNSHSFNASISADGRYVAFDSSANNLVAGDTSSRFDVFVHDRQTGQTSRLSQDSDGTQGNSQSFSPSISADGRYVAFLSHANNLVAGDTNSAPDIFVAPIVTASNASLEVTVNNVAPSFDAGQDETLLPPQAGAFSRSGIAITDPGSLDTFTGTVNFGDDTGEQPLVIDQVSRTFDVDHVYTTSGTFTVEVTVEDDDLGSFTDTFEVTVILNTPPVAHAGGPYRIDEGSGLTLDASASTDAENNISAYSWDLDNDGQFDDASGVAPILTWSDLIALGIDDDGTYAIALSVQDAFGETDTASSQITIVNVAPTVSAVAVTPVIDENGTVNLSFNVTDPGTLDTFTLVIDWGDGTSSNFGPSSLGTGSFSFGTIHQYLDDSPSGTPADDYNIGINVTD